MEIPIVVAEDEINVAGFVDTINLSVDVGPQGERGSIIFSGVGEPPATTESLDPIFNNVDIFKTGDLYIRLSTSNYSWLYMYQDLPGGGDWTSVLRLSPAFYTVRSSVVFTAGEGAVLDIPLINIIGTTDSTGFSADDFVVTATVLDSDDTYVYVVGVKSVAFSGTNLRVYFNSRRLADTAVTATATTLTLNIMVGVNG